MPRKESSWRSFLTSCGGGSVAPRPKVKLVAKQKSLKLRLSFSDFGNCASPEELSLIGTNLYVFTLSELNTVTQGFLKSNFLGEGGFGPVYKGFVDDKMKPGLKAQPVAVKLLDLEGGQGHKEWLSEVIFLGQLRHPHLVKLIGYCCEDEHRLLVYEFMARGSLENHLFKRLFASLPWQARIKIAVGAAKGLAFLHEAEQPVIYRDFKASNILLDSFSQSLSVSTSVEAVINGKRLLKLLTFGENYEMDSPRLLIRMLSRPSADWVGDVKIQCKDSGLEADICYYRNIPFLGLVEIIGWLRALYTIQNH